MLEPTCEKEIMFNIIGIIGFISNYWYNHENRVKGISYLVAEIRGLTVENVAAIVRHLSQFLIKS